MTTLKPTENSQIFKRLYTEKARVFDKLKKKSELCKDYCEILGVSVDKSKPGQNEYKQLSFDKQCSIPHDRAQKVIDLYISHINDVEAEIKEQLFSEQDIQNTPGLIRCKVQKQDALYDKKLGSLKLEFDEFYQVRSETAFNHNIIHKSAFQRIFNIPILMALVGVVILYTVLKPVASTTIEEVYTQEKHDDILNQREKQITDELSVLYRSIKANNKQNEKLISLLEKRLNETRWDLSTAKNNMASYHNELAFLQDRNNYLDSIKDQLAPELYQEARDALAHGNKLKAYELYENFKQKGKSTIEQIAQANFEQGVIDEDRLKYQDAFMRYERAAYLQAENSEFNNKAGFLADTLGHFNKAIEYYEKALNSDLKTFGESHPDVAKDWNNLGKTWMTLAKYDKAIEFVEKALVSNLKTYGTDHSSVAHNWGTLGNIYLLLGQYKKSIEYHEKALASNLKTYGENHPDVTFHRYNLGNSWRFLQQYDKALAYYEKAFASDLNTYGDNHPNVAVYRNYLALVWLGKGQHYKAIEYFEKALESDIKTYGENHFLVAARWNNIGTTWADLGQYDKAIEYLEKALASDIKTYGVDHPEVALRWANLGSTSDLNGQYDKAIEYLEKALASNLKTYGKDHPYVAIIWNRMGMAWEAIGQYDKAIGYLEKSLASDIATSGEDHPHVATSWNNLGMAWKAKGNYDKAIKYVEKALASDLKTYGEDHPDVAIDRNNLGEAWYSKGQYDKAIAYYDKALPVFNIKLGKDHHRTKKCLTNLELTKKQRKQKNK